MVIALTRGRKKRVMPRGRPRKNPVPEVTAKPISEDAVIEIEIVELQEPSEVIELCGHKNVHYSKTNPLVCVLVKGHEGDHEADYVNAQGTQRGYWGDAAGVEPGKFVPSPEFEERRLHLDNQRRIYSEDDNLRKAKPS